MNSNKVLTLEEFHMPRWKELPNVDLYLDQVVTLINTSLKIFLPDISSEKAENQILTKTMINNYVKNNLIEAPNKKKYSKIQLAKLFSICILKQVYSMNDIANLILIALKNNKEDVVYDSFCDLFEEALRCTFEKKDFKYIDEQDDNKYLLKSVLLSCTYKIYAQSMIPKII